MTGTNSILNKSLNRFLATVLLVYSIGFAIAAGFSIVVNEIHHRQMAGVIAASAGMLIDVGDLRNTILGFESAREQYFSAIGYFQPTGEKNFILPVMADVMEFKTPSLLSRLLTARHSRDVLMGNQPDVKRGVLVFLFPRFAYVPYAIAIWLASLMISTPFLMRMRNRMIRRAQEEAELRKNAELSKQAEDVAHNIRSPLTALDNLLESAATLPEGDRILMRSAAHRIKDIINTLDMGRGGSGSKDQQLGVHLISSLVESIVSEKRVQYRKRSDIEIDVPSTSESYGLFAKVQPAELKAVLSNLINNSVEAMKSGKIVVSLRGSGVNVAIAVSDNGPGITEDVLSRLTERGVTVGKKDHRGIGLSHAKTVLEKWRGDLQISSTLGVGTTVTALVPKELPPSWFVPELRICPQTKVVVLDDDASIHHVWEQRFKASVVNGARPDILHASTPDEFRHVVAKQEGRDAVFLVDYELLNFPETGLDLVEALRIAPQSILVTSRFEDAAVVERCNRLGVRLIPKTIANLVPIRVDVEAEQSLPDGVLIDDDSHTRTMWQAIAGQKGRRLLTFEGSHAFFLAAARIPFETPIYVDRRLGAELGDDVSRRVSELGFTEVWLTTGEIPDTLPPMPWLRGVRGKRPPW
jgi:signal transduction histidine kinase